MSEHTDDILDGLFCQSCNAFMGNACGYPRSCKDCSGVTAAPNPAKINYPQCNKRVKAIGLAVHQRVVHGMEPSK